MSQHTSTPSGTCANVARLLPLASHDLLSADEASMLRTHLATCAACRAELAVYQRVEEAWQRGMAPRGAAAPVVSQAEMLSFIADEPGATIARARKRAGPSAPAAPSAAQRSRSPRFVAGISALASCLLIAVIVGAAFLARGYNIGIPGGQTQTTKTPASSYQNISDSELSDIAMVSATEGWAIGGASHAVYEHGTDPDTNLETPLLWHYLNGTWSPVQLSIRGQLRSISMDSPTDGWVIGIVTYSETGAHMLLLHYNGHTWEQVPAGDIQPQRFPQIQMIAPTDGWIGGEAFPIFSEQYFPYTGIWHYDGSGWKVASLPAALIERLQQGDTFQAASISMISASEGWIAGTLLPSIPDPSSGTPTPSDLSPSGVILHYTDGNWEVQQIVPQTYLHAASMLSSTDGWIGGEQDIRTAESGGAQQPDTLHPRLLHYVQGQWVDASSSIGSTSSGMETILSVFMRSPTDGWAVFLAKDLTHALPKLLHYNGSKWSAVNLPTIKNTSIYRLARVFMVSATDGWLVGSRDLQTFTAPYTYQTVPVLYHLHNGTWSLAQLPGK